VVRAGLISRGHGALTLRTLQTLAEVAVEHNSTLVFPIPIDVLDTVRSTAVAAIPASGRLGPTADERPSPRTVPPEVGDAQRGASQAETEEPMSAAVDHDARKLVAG
jgi:hypothetical protein